MTHIREEYIKASQAFARLVFAFAPEYSFLTAVRNSIRCPVWPRMDSCRISCRFEDLVITPETWKSMNMDFLWNFFLLLMLPLTNLKPVFFNVKYRIWFNLLVMVVAACFATWAHCSFSATLQIAQVNETAAILLYRVLRDLAISSLHRWSWP